MKYKINDKSFKTIQDVLDYYKISSSAFYNYKKIYPDKSVEELICEYLEENTYRINGKEFRSISELCRHYKISLSSFERCKVKNPDVPVEKLLTDYLLKNKIVAFGKVYNSYKEICEQYKINNHLFYTYRKNNKDKSIEEIINECLKIEDLRKNKIVVAYGIKFKNTNQLCHYYDIPATTYKKYKEKFPDLTVEEIITKCKQSRRINWSKDIIIEDKVFKGIIAACKYYGISYSTLVKRKTDNPDLTVEDILRDLIYLRKIKDNLFGESHKSIRIFKNSKVITVEDKKFINLQDVLKYYKIPVKTFYRLRDNNTDCSVEELIHIYKDSFTKREKYVLDGKVFNSKKRK